MIPFGTKVRTLVRIGYHEVGATGTVIDLNRPLLNGWDYAVQFATEPVCVLCMNADEIEPVQ